MKRAVIHNRIKPAESYETRLRRAYLGMVNTIERELGKKHDPSEIFGLAVMLALSCTEAESIEDSLDNADVFNAALRQALATNHEVRNSKLG